MYYYNTGDSSILFLLADINSGNDADFSDMIKWKIRYANYSGKPEVMYSVGQSYYQQSSNQNTSQTIYWYERAAEKGHAEAMYSLSGIYQYGNNGFKEYKDKKKGKEWWKKYEAAKK